MGTIVFRSLIYPTVFFGSMGVLVTLVGQGVAYWRVGPFLLLLVALVVTALEQWLPHAQRWQEDQGDTRTDLLHLAGNVLVSQVSILVYGRVSAWTGAGLGLWPSQLPFWAQFLLGVTLVDLGLYGVHRLSHRVSWLWALHAIHHSPRRVYWLNGQRRHLLHELIEGTPGLLVLGLLGAPASVGACALAAVTIHLMFQHGNIAYRAGWLRYVFAVAELHRWHHQRLYAEVQGNYGAIFSVWDHLFGTALAKTGEAPLDVGMDDEPDLPADYLGQLSWPFRRKPRPALAQNS